MSCEYQPAVSNFKKGLSSGIRRLVSRQVPRLRRNWLPSLQNRIWAQRQQVSPECWYLSVKYMAPKLTTFSSLYEISCTCSEVFSSGNVSLWVRPAFLVSHPGCLLLLVPGILATTHLMDAHDSTIASEDDSCPGNRNRPVIPLTDNRDKTP